MKKTSFTFGAIAGATSLAIALPMVAQLASAATDTNSTNQAGARPVPTQECVLALAERDTNFLAKIDSMTAAHKAATIAHRDALTAAAAITDDTERQDALKKAQEDFRTAIQTARGSEDHTAGMEALKAACGDSFRGGFGMSMKGGDRMGGHMMKGPMLAKIAEKLGMTEDELKTALESGKTIEEIADEKGITLPTRPEGGKGKRGGMMHFMHNAETDDDQ